MNDQANHTTQTDRSVPGLLRDLSHEVTSLVHSEAQLLKAETREAVHDIKTGVVSSGLGLVVLFTGIFWLAGAGVYGLSLTMPMWQAALIVGGGIVVLGAIIMAVARHKLSSSSLRPERTERQLHEDARVARRKTV